MAYVVGSASVEIVPDFRNAQLAITAFFAKQQNELRLPVKPDISPEAQRGAEQQARVTGARVGKAMADAAEKEAEKQRQRDLRAQERLGAQMAQDVARSLVAREKEQAASDARALKAQERLGEQMARLTEKAVADRIAGAERERAAQERLGEQMARITEKAIADRQTAAERERAAQVRLGEQMTRDIERQQAERQRAVDKSVNETIRAIEREAAESQRIRDRAHKETIRAQEREAKETLAAINQVFADAEKVRVQVEVDREQAIMEGRTAGGLVARAIKQEMHQNAGLITAAVTGALLVGGPAVVAGAQGLFLGVAAVGAFQSQKLRETWLDMFDDIRIAGVNDTAVLVPAFERMAGGIGASFERMRPQIREGLAEAPILIDMFTESLTTAAESAMPGLVRSITNGRPVMQGFGDLLESLGQGTTDFLDEINEHAPAAGQSLTGLGKAMGQLMPAVGELLGEGAELGTIVLPVLTSALGGTRTVIEKLGGSLPVLASGFLAFRAIQGTGRFVNQFSQSLERLGPNLGVYTAQLTGSDKAGTRVMTSTGKAASAVAGFGRALPGIGIAVGVLAAVMANGSQKTNDYAQAMLAGGSAAKKATEDISDPSPWEQLTYSVSNIFSKDAFTNMSIAERQMNDVREKVQELEAAMSPLELAQSRLAGWTNELALRMDDESYSAEDVAIAQRKVAEYSAKSASEQEKLERATRGVTEAMAAQADQARSRVDEAFAYQQSLLDTQDASMKLVEAQDALNKARAEGDPTKIAAAEFDLKQALLDTNTAMSDQVAAAEALAMSKLPASMDDTQKKVLGAKAALDELNAIMASGIPLPPEMEAYRQQLLGIVNGADGAKLAQAQLVTAFGEVGLAVSAIPDTKSVQVTAPTDGVIQGLKDLGFTVEQVPGSKDVIVSADTEAANGNLGNLSALLAALDAADAKPTADLDPAAFTDKAAYVNAVLAQLAGEKPTPTADIETNPLSTGIGLATGLVNTLGLKRPTPVADLNRGPLLGSFGDAINRLGILAGQRPTPVADANINPLSNGLRIASGALDILGRLRPTPVITAIDNASGIASRVQAVLNGLRDKTITITTLTQGRTITGASAADGGAVEGLTHLRKFDGGGAVYGRGGPRDDLIPALGPDPFARYRIANGEHILDGRDVALMGGQAGVYAFREALNSGAFSTPSQSAGIREMVSVSGGQAAGAAASRPSTPSRNVALYTPDVPTALRALKAMEHQEEVLASPWP